MGDAFTLGNGRYRLVTPLGEGGMATVWRAIDSLLGAERAIKILSPDMAAKRKIRQRFDNEGRAMGRLAHPNVIQVFDLGVEEGLPYMVMEVADGGSTEDWCQRHGPMPERLVCDVAIALLDALGAAHHEGIVHRDVKPANVLLTSRGAIKITDFGIAHVDDAAMTRTGTVMGTWAFMAPEQKGDAKAADARSDLFAVGATMVALLTAATPDDLLAPEATATLAERVHPALWDVVRAAIRLRPDDRFATAAAMRDALRAVQPELVLDPAAPPLGERVLPPLPEIPAASFDAPVEAPGGPAPEFPAGWGENETTVPSEPPAPTRSPVHPPPITTLAEPAPLPPPVQWPPPSDDKPPSWVSGDTRPAPPPPSFPPPVPEDQPRSGPPYALLGVVAVLGMVATAALLAVATIYTPPAPAPAPPPPSPFVAEPLHPELQPGYVAPDERPAAAPPSKPKPKGALTLMSIPHADVTIDGRASGDTRDIDRSLVVGTHTIDMTSFITGKKTHLSVDIAVDAPTTVCWSFQRDSYCTDAEVKTAMTPQ